ncbi:MAG TPA: radical SAM protein [Erysipelotrichaceae bacterium]|nr:radical SAM protein [Erysipelotrichaceae bacterium]
MFQRIYIEITNTCNLNCVFCLKNKRSPKMMTLDEFKHVMQEIKDHTQHIYLHVQGEPFMHPNLLEFMDLAHEAKLKVHLVTNGTYLNRVDYALYQHPALVQLSVSLHALQINELDRNHIVLKQLIQDSAIHHFSLFLRIWRFDDHDARSKLSQLIGIAIDQLPMKRSKIATNLFIDLDDTFTWPSFDNPFVSNQGYCHSGTKLIAILADGTVTPCCLDANGLLKLGNIHQNSFISIINDERLTIFNRSFNQNQCSEELCKHCTYRLRFNKKRGITL